MREVGPGPSTLDEGELGLDLDEPGPFGSRHRRFGEATEPAARATLEAESVEERPIERRQRRAKVARQRPALGGVARWPTGGAYAHAVNGAGASLTNDGGATALTKWE
jgi:hypothetical protein